MLWQQGETAPIGELHPGQAGTCTWHLPLLELESIVVSSPREYLGVPEPCAKQRNLCCHREYLRVPGTLCEAEKLVLSLRGDVLCRRSNLQVTWGLLCFVPRNRQKALLLRTFPYCHREYLRVPGPCTKHTNLSCHRERSMRSIL